MERETESSLTMEDHFHIEEFRTRVEAKSTEAGSRGYGIGEDFHDGEKDLLSSEVLLQPNANEMLLAKQDDGKEGDNYLQLTIGMNGDLMLKGDTALGVPDSSR
ncbi:unnamed protein product [Cyprideis torosa]|uniref:Uncharacterized protein n=1 Tax=Cyprideis torosa TaxID=163714 RepID=A0A7R8WH31_9CRUS|nr:unnamed protein product [Cyprideis torosa]CAG0898937.1 unnamed protein product [Cyprideis torosa]